jgi:hypothetical protein
MFSQKPGRPTHACIFVLSSPTNKNPTNKNSSYIKMLISIDVAVIQNLGRQIQLLQIHHEAEVWALYQTANMKKRRTKHVSKS